MSFRTLIRSNAGILAGVWLLSGLIGLALGPGEPSTQGIHLLGLDSEGRDVLRRLFAGILPTLGFAGVMSLLIAFVGSIIGVFAGLGARIVDLVSARLAEGLSAFPTFLAVLVVQGVIGHANLWTLGLAILLTRVPDAARIVRTEAQRLRATDFVLAGAALGASKLDLFRRELWPHLFATIRSIAFAGLLPCLLAETIASLLGVGLERKLTWGAILADALGNTNAVRIVASVTVALALVVLSLRFGVPEAPPRLFGLSRPRER